MSVRLHAVLLDELVEAEGVGELQADVAAVEGGGSLPLHLLVPVLTELGHQLGQKRGTVSWRCHASPHGSPCGPIPLRAEEGGTQGTPSPLSPRDPLHVYPAPHRPQPLRAPLPGFPPPAAPKEHLPGLQGWPSAPSGPLTFTRMSLDSLGLQLEKHCPKQRKMVKSGDRSLRLSRKSLSSAKQRQGLALG